MRGLVKAGWRPLSTCPDAPIAVTHFKKARRLRPESWNYMRQAFALGDPERDYGTNFAAEVGKLGGKLYYPLLDLDGTGRNAEQEAVAFFRDFR